MNVNLLRELKTGCNENSAKGSRPVSGRKPAQPRAGYTDEELGTWNSNIGLD
jgi:hypothetical protein